MGPEGVARGPHGLSVWCLYVFIHGHASKMHADSEHTDTQLSLDIRCQDAQKNFIDEGFIYNSLPRQDRSLHPAGDPPYNLRGAVPAAVVISVYSEWKYCSK
jgi:hypothetical protein